MRRTWIPLVALLLLSLPASAQFFGGKNKIRYDTFDWQVYETPHFRISYYDRVEPNLQEVASFAESSYDELARKLNYQIRRPIPMLIYATHTEFEQTNVIVGFIAEGVGAFATPVRNRMVLPVDLPARELQALIQHELAHIFQYEILFQGRRGRAIYSRPPLWFMEGMASYYGDDEVARDEAYMRDAALSNMVPSVTSNLGGFFAYRYGHKVFEFIEAEWGEDGVRDFVMAFRSSLGGRVNRPFRRVFKMDAEEFDSRFKAWLRTQYREEADRGMPEEFGRRFRVDEGLLSQETSPVGSPSGDLIAAFSTYKNEIDVVLLGVPDRRLYKNLTKGYTRQYEYLVAQALTVGPDRGRDLSFSPDSNQVAVFGRTERTRSLFLLNAVEGGIDRIVEIPLPIERPTQPAFSPDGSMVAFQAFKEGKGDIFLLDLESEKITNLTADDAFDGSPVFSPDGQSVIYSAQAGEIAKLVRISLADPSKREQITFGEGSDEGPAFSADGKRLYFASDRDAGVLDIYQLDLETRRLVKVTNVIGMAINPVPVETLEGERVVFQTFARGRWDLFIADPNEGEVVGTEGEPQMGMDLEPYVPAMSLTIDPSRSKPVKGVKFFLEDAATYVGIDRDSNFVSNTYMGFSDQYGDKRITILAQSVRSYTNINLSYIDLEPRLQWGVTAFDRRSYYLFGYDPFLERFEERERVYRETGGALIGQYPLSRYLRLEGTFGYIDRAIDYPILIDPTTIGFISYDDQMPFVSVGLVGDTTVWRRHGPHAGSRWQTNLFYGHDLDEGGSLTRQVEVEARQYIPLTSRTEIAARLFLAAADGNRPSIFAFGGLDTMRGVRVRSVGGNRAGYLNLELRFPLIDRLSMPFLEIRDIRGRIFTDVGAAWYDIDGQEFNYVGRSGFDFMEDGRLKDGIGAYGFGFSLTLLGLPVHWDFVKRWDLKDTIGDTEVDFWIGYRF